jgi:hypothetical protein
MHDPHRLNGHPSWPPPSPWDLVISRIDRLGSHIGHLEGRMEMGFEMTSREITEGFKKSDKAHERITRLQQHVEAIEQWLRQRRSPGPPPAIPPPPAAQPTPPPGGPIANTLTALTKCLEAAKELQVPLKEVIVAATLLATAVGLIAHKAVTPPPSPSAVSTPER